MKRLTIAVAAAGLTIAACGADSDESDAAPTEETTETDTGGTSDGGSDESAGGVRLISPADAATIQSSPPEGLVILDVRTPEEFEEIRLDGSVMLDFYEADFADQLAELDPDVPYLLYCRSGNRSGQTRAIMESLGFTDVADVDGGILAWEAGGNPVVSG